MIKVGVAGYGVIGQRLADGVACQKDMELVGVADVAPTLSVRALKEKGMPYDLYNSLPENQNSAVPGRSKCASFTRRVKPTRSKNSSNWMARLRPRPVASRKAAACTASPWSMHPRAMAARRSIVGSG